MSDTETKKVPVSCYKSVIYGNDTESYAHFHDSVELVYLVEGHISLLLNGKSSDFSAGDLAIIISNEVHDLLSIAKKSEYICVKFHPDVLSAGTASSAEAKYVVPFLSNLASYPNIIPAESVSQTKIPEFINDLLKENTERTLGFELAMRGDIFKIVRDMIGFLAKRGYDVEYPTSSGNMYLIISDAVEYVNNNFVSCDEKEVADRFNVSYSYFSRSFKQVMKMSFKEYVNYLKVNEAQRLLITTAKSITDISQELAFSSPSHFINVFKKLKGCSPKQYKKTL